MPRPAAASPVTRIPRSGIRTLMELALRDPDAIHLEIGEPDAAPPAHVVDAVAAAARDGRPATPRASASTRCARPRPSA